MERYSLATALRVGTMILGAMWMALFVYTDFIDTNPALNSFDAPDVREQMQACNGNYQQRYECKESIIIAKNQGEFLIWLKEVAVIMGPPLVLWWLVQKATAQRQKAPQAPQRRRPATAPARPVAGTRPGAPRRRMPR